MRTKVIEALRSAVAAAREAVWRFLDWLDRNMFDGGDGPRYV